MQHLFFDLRATHNPHRWFMPLSPAVCVGPSDNLFMFGGVGLASAIGAMERTTGRPLIWATAQYLSYARPAYSYRNRGYDARYSDNSYGRDRYDYRDRDRDRDGDWHSNFR